MKKRWRVLLKVTGAIVVLLVAGCVFHRYE